MTTTPRSPTPKRRRVAWTLRALILAGLGVAAYYGLELADDLLIQRLAGSETPPIEVIELPPTLTTAPRGPSEGPGNGLLRRSVFALDGRQSLSAKIQQDGWIDGQPVATRGEYHQLGGGAERAFLLKQSGQLAGRPTRLIRVSDSRFLWTDLAWGSDTEEAGRSVIRVDLRRVRRAVKEDADGANLASDPSAWSRLGGLPMLVSGLDEAFAFGQPRRMQLRGTAVLAMVGRWRPERLEQLTGGDAPPPRAPQHVVIALDEATLLPVLLEYRDYRDPLSYAGLADDKLLTPSKRPLLKIELKHEPNAPPLDKRMFVYRPNEEGWSDQTERELRLVRESRNGATMASAGRESIR